MIPNFFQFFNSYIWAINNINCLNIHRWIYLTNIFFPSWMLCKIKMLELMYGFSVHFKKYIYFKNSYLHTRYYHKNIFLLFFNIYIRVSILHQ
jgi:hypothetical protein